VKRFGFDSGTSSCADATTAGAWQQPKNCQSKDISGFSSLPLL